MLILRNVLYVAGLLLFSNKLFAAEFLAGLGYDDIIDGDHHAFAATAELRSEPIWTLSNFQIRAGAAVEGDTDGDVWGGFRPVVTYPFNDKARAVASLMVGGYSQGDGNDLGHGIEFRSLIGADYKVYKDYRLGFSFEHKSNASIGSSNPGVETLYVTVVRNF